jgi:hypothetical protein
MSNFIAILQLILEVDEDPAIQTVSNRLGRATAQLVSRRLPTAAARFRAQVKS